MGHTDDDFAGRVACVAELAKRALRRSTVGRADAGIRRKLSAMLNWVGRATEPLLAVFESLARNALRLPVALLDGFAAVLVRVAYVIRGELVAFDEDKLVGRERAVTEAAYEELGFELGALSEERDEPKLGPEALPKVLPASAACDDTSNKTAMATDCRRFMAKSKKLKHI